MPTSTNTLTAIGQLDLATGISANSQVFINPNPNNNTIQRASLGALTEYLYPPGDLISNTGGTQTAYELGSNLAFAAATGTNTLGTLDFSAITSGHVIGNGGTVSAVPSSIGLSPLLDQNFSLAEGAMLVRGPSTWTALLPGTAGYVLSTGGTAGLPSWVQGVAGPNIPAEAALLSTTASSTFQGLALGANLTLTGTTLAAAGSNWALSDGTTSTPAVSNLLVPGGHVTNAGGITTLTLSGIPWSISDGATTVSSVSTLHVAGAGASVSGTAGVATLTVSSGGTGGGANVPGAGLVLSTGTSLATAVLASNLSLSAGTLGVAVPNSANFLGTSAGGTFVGYTFGSGFSLAGTTVSATAALLPASAAILGSNAGGTATPVVLGTNLSISSAGGTNTLNAASSGGTGGGGPLYAPGWGSFRSTGVWQRPTLASLTKINWTTSGYVGTGGAYVEAQDIAGGPIHFANAGLDTIACGTDPGSSPWTATFMVSMQSKTGYAHRMGVLVANTTTNNFLFCYIYTASSPSTLYVDRRANLNIDGISGSHQFTSTPLFLQSNLTFRIQYDGTNINFSTSTDPLSDKSFTTIYSEPLSAYLASANLVGFALQTGESGPDAAVINVYGMSITTP